MLQKKYFRLLTVSFLVMLFLSPGCRWGSRGEGPGPGPGEPRERVMLYLADNRLVEKGHPGPYGYLVPVEREVAPGEDLHREVVEQLLIGPLPGDGDVSRTLPGGAVLLDLDLEGGRAGLSFRGDFFEHYTGGTLAGTLFVDSLVYTLTEFPTIDRVMVTLEGEPWCDGHFTWDRPLGRDDIRDDTGGTGGQAGDGETPHGPSFGVAWESQGLPHPVVATAVGDFTGRGQGEIVAAAGSEIYLFGPGEGEMYGLEASTLAGFIIYDLAAGDLTGSGRDQVYACGPGEIVVLEWAPESGSGGFQEVDRVQVKNWSLALGDLDGRGDRLYSSSEAGVRPLDWEGGRLRPGGLIPGIPGGTIAIGDTTGDGRQEMVIRDAMGVDLSVYRVLQGELTLAWSTGYPMESLGSIPAVGDMDNNGVQEILVSDFSGGWQVFYYARGTYSRGGLEDRPVFLHPEQEEYLDGITLWDLTGNGLTELIAGRGRGLVIYAR